jgi:hypothetical protein
MQIMIDKDIRIDNKKLHPLFEDIESIFWFFILANNALTNPEVEDVIRRGGDPTAISMLDKYKVNIGLKTKIDYKNNKYNSKANVKKEMIAIGKAMAILMYDYILSSKYFPVLSKLEEFNFLKFIRNGAAHHNKFNLRDEEGNWKIRENESIKWNNKSIIRNVHKKVVFNDFVFFVDMFLLAGFFSEKMKEFDKQK